MTIRLAERLSRVQPSITLAITAKAGALRAQGVDIVSFGAGEPDFDTPEHIIAAADKAMHAGGVGKYTNVQGIVPLRQAVVAELARAHDVPLSADQVLVSCGAKHSLYNLFMALLDPGDEVIIPAPYWVSYPDMVKLAGGEPVIAATSADDGFMLTPEALEAAITPKTRALVLNTPSNPTGAVYTRERLEALARICVARDLLVVSDDIYRSLVYGDTAYVSMASLSREVAERTVFIDGVSKTYAMTGWRIGYAAGPIELIKAMTKIQGQSTSNASHVAQIAALAALTGSQECVAEMRGHFDQRRKRMVELLCAIPGVGCSEPKGAFYAFPDVSAFLGKKTPAGQEIADDVALAAYLVEDANVALVPGSGFGAPGFARLSYACSMADIEKGIGRMAEALAQLH